MPALWSEKLAAHYGLRLPPDLRAWIDDGVWRTSGGAEFNRPQSPKHLIEPNGAIWGGFMPPNTLPLVGNDSGDWLTLQIDADGGVSEVLYWNHGGGDWIPYGNSLAEALLYDAARQPVAAGDESPVYARWAAQQLTGAGYEPGPWQAVSQRERLIELLTAGVACEAARRDLILVALQWALRESGNPQMASALGVLWEPDFVKWQFDA
jgi:hypothetical protein